MEERWPEGPPPGVGLVHSRKSPSLATLERWMDDGIAEATDGCPVEPDGTCEHGYQSWLLRLGLI